MDKLSTKELENLFFSNNTNDVIKFYDNFSSSKDLIDWFCARPRSPPRFYETQGSTNVIVVVTTANHEKDMAKECLKIYDGLKIIFVESSGRNFHYTHNCNAGLKRALKYKPEWVILSNDDMYMIDNINVLLRELKKISNKDVKVLVGSKLGKESAGVGLSLVARRRYLSMLYREIKGDWRSHYNDILNRFGAKYEIIPGGTARLKLWPFYSYKKQFLAGGAFKAFSYEYLKRVNGNIYDEKLQYNLEDDDLFFSFDKNEYKKINFRIGHLIGGTWGVNPLRTLQGLYGTIYFNYKHSRDI